MVDISLRSACFKQSCSLAVAYLSLTNRRWNHHPSSVLASAGFTTYRCCFELSEIYQGSSERADRHRHLLNYLALNSLQAGTNPLQVFIE